MRRKRVAIVHPWANIDSIPSIFNAIDLLVRADYDVDIYTRVDKGHVPVAFDQSGVRVFTPWDRFARRGLGRCLSDKWYGPLCMVSRHLQRPYACVIAVDPNGLHHTDNFMRYFKAPVAYFSLELLLSHELFSDLQRYLKTRERPLSRQSDFIIIQDEDRARLMADDNDIEMDRFVCVPNAPLGPSKRSEDKTWHRRFGLKAEQRVVLHPGSIAKWTGIDDIVASVKDWPEGWVLVLHTREDMTSSDRIAELRKLAPKDRVLFSLKPVSRHEYDQLVESADMGIAFYEPVPGSAYTQENIRTIGLSSGKIAYYLRAGIPTIVNRSSMISELIEQEGCGVGVESAASIGDAIQRIDADYDAFAEAACRTFDRDLDFERHFRAVIERIEQLKIKRKDTQCLPQNAPRQTVQQA